MRDALVRQGVDRLDAALAVIDAGDGGGTLVYANDAWTALDVPGTVPAAAAVGDACLPACDGLDGGAVRDTVEALLAGETDRARTEYAHTGDTLRRFRLSGRTFSADGGEYVLLDHEEVTDQYRVERERDHYAATLADVATVISHDIRSPLSAAHSWMELLEADPDADAETVRRVRSALGRINTILDDAVTLARETAVDDRRPVDVGRLARSVWNSMDTAGAALQVAEMEPVLADEDSLGTVLEHLLRNAVEHGSTSPHSDAREDAVEYGSTSRRTPSDDALTVRVGPLEDGTGFYVADDGSGVEEALVDELFDPGITTRATADNVGIGLAIVRRAVEAHGWEIALAEAQQGARFEITGVDAP